MGACERFFGRPVEELLTMPGRLFFGYYVPTLRELSQSEHLLAIEAASFPHMDEKARKQKMSRFDRHREDTRPRFPGPSKREDETPEERKERRRHKAKMIEMVHGIPVETRESDDAE